MLESICHDIRLAFRTLRKNIVPTTVAIVTVAMGIGINTGVFTVVNAISLRSLPYKDSDRLVWIWSSNVRGPLKQRASYPDFLDWRDQNQSFERLVGWNEYSPVLTGPGDPVRLRGQLTLGNLFSVIGVSPMLGTLAEAEKDRPEGSSVVLSYNLWQRTFASDPHIIGRRITLDGIGYTVAAVMPARFDFPTRALSPTDAWVRVQRFNPVLANRREARLIEVMARLKPNVTVAQAQADMDRIAENLRNEYPSTNSGISIRVIGGKDEIVGNVSLALLALFGAAVCVLCIACVNVANLQLAKTAARVHELMMRVVLGASRARIVQQLFIESVLIGVSGGIIGCGVAFWSLNALKGLLPPDIPRASEVNIDWRVLAFAVVVSLTASVLFGLATAFRPAKTSRGRGSALLVVAEIALAMLLLAVGGLFAKTFWRLNKAEAGFDPHQVLTFGISLPSLKYPKPGQAFEQIQAQLQAIPGVRAASVGLQLPDRDATVVTDIAPFFEVEGRPSPSGSRPRASILTIQPDYFHTMGIALIRGRAFTDADRFNVPPVIIVNESLARTYFSNEDPIGKRIVLDSWVAPGQKTIPQIVGVAGDVKHSGVTDAQPRVYASMSQYPRWTSLVAVKTDGDPLRFVAAVRDAIRGFDSELPIDDIQTLEHRIAQSFAREQFNALLVGLFSALALMLAAVGLYGVLSFAIVQRTRDIGIRIAIGAERGGVLKLVLGQGLKMAVAGVAVGLLGAFGITRLVRGLLFNVSPIDPLTFVFAGAVLLSVATLACWIPARWATSVDPIIALRHE
jgi:putative ABC transport system permease protein